MGLGGLGDQSAGGRPGRKRLAHGCGVRGGRRVVDTRSGWVGTTRARSMLTDRTGVVLAALSGCVGRRHRMKAAGAPGVGAVVGGLRLPTGGAVAKVGGRGAPIFQVTR